MTVCELVQPIDIHWTDLSRVREACGRLLPQDRSEAPIAASGVAGLRAGLSAIGGAGRSQRQRHGARPRSARGSRIDRIAQRSSPLAGQVHPPQRLLLLCHLLRFRRRLHHLRCAARPCRAAGLQEAAAASGDRGRRRAEWHYRRPLCKVCLRRQHPRRQRLGPRRRSSRVDQGNTGRKRSGIRQVDP